MRKKTIILSLLALMILPLETLSAGADDTDEPIVRNHLKLQQQQGYQVTRRYSGEVRAQRRSRMAFQVAGFVSRALVEEGDRVVKGQVLIQLDRRLLLASVNVVRASLANAQARGVLAQRSFERSRKLYAQGHISQQQQDQALANFRTSVAGVNQARANLNLALVNYEYGELIAPYNARVQERFVDEGAVVAAGVAVLELVEDGALEVVVGLPEQIARRMNEDEPYVIHINKEEIKATLLGITPALANNTRTLRARFAIPPQTHAVTGALAELQIKQQRDESGYWVPLGALTEASRGLWALYTLTPSSLGLYNVERRLVEVLHSEYGKAFIQGSVREGECILPSGVQLVVPGQRVKLNDGNSCGG